MMHLLMLLRPDASPLDDLLETLLVVVGNRYILMSKDDTTTLNHLDFLWLHDKGAMHTDKTIDWKHIL